MHGILRVIRLGQVLLNLYWIYFGDGEYTVLDWTAVEKILR